MTDKEIIKAFECCIKPTSDCENCPYYIVGDGDCVNKVKEDALNFISEQQVLIGHLTMDNRVLKEKRINLFERLEIVSKARAEAIKEFAEKLKDMSDVWEDDEFYFKYVTTEQIDNLVKEMGADNG